MAKAILIMNYFKLVETFFTLDGVTFRSHDCTSVALDD